MNTHTVGVPEKLTVGNAGARRGDLLNTLRISAEFPCGLSYWDLRRKSAKIYSKKRKNTFIEFSWRALRDLT